MSAGVRGTRPGVSVLHGVVAADIATVRRYRDLIRYIVRGQLRASVVNTVLGDLWHVLTPLARIVVYYFLIVVVFQRGGDFGHSPVLVITMGVMHYMVVMQTVSQALPAVYNSASLLLQVRVDPVVLVAAAFYKALRTSLIGVGLFLLLYAATAALPGWSVLAYPLVLAALVWLSWIVSLLVSAVAVFARDLERLVPLVLQILMYASPVIYTVGFIPEDWRSAYLASPIATLFALLQWTLLGTPPPSVMHVALLAGVLLVGTVFAHRMFNAWKARFTKVF